MLPFPQCPEHCLCTSAGVSQMGVPRIHAPFTAVSARHQVSQSFGATWDALRILKDDVSFDLRPAQKRTVKEDISPLEVHWLGAHTDGRTQAAFMVLLVSFTCHCSQGSARNTVDITLDLRIATRVLAWVTCSPSPFFSIKFPGDAWHRLAAATSSPVKNG